MTEHKLRVAREMIAGGRHTMQEIADTIGVGRATLYRHLEPLEQVPCGVAAREHASASSTPIASTPAAVGATAVWGTSAHEQRTR